MPDTLEQWVTLFKRTSLLAISEGDIINFAIFIEEEYEREKANGSTPKLAIIRRIYLQAAALSARINQGGDYRYDVTFQDILLQMKENFNQL